MQLAGLNMQIQGQSSSVLSMLVAVDVIRRPAMLLTLRELVGREGKGWVYGGLIDALLLAGAGSDR